MTVRPWFCLAAVLSLVACGDPSGGTDPDANRSDVLAADAPSADANRDAAIVPPDRGTPDAREAGVGLDASSEAGATDAIAPRDGALDARDGSLADASSDAAVRADGGPECRTSAECATSFGGPVCDTARGLCVLCTTANDPCPSGSYCADNRCATGCRVASDCTGSSTHCDTTVHRCVGCTADRDCSPGTVCLGGTCQPGCNAAHACGVGDTCCGGACTNVQLSATNCGRCGVACGSGSACCNGACTGTARDVANCGVCGNVCNLRDATEACVNSACAIATCTPGFADCNGVAGDGCESRVSSDPANCGGCARRCPSGVNSRATCSLGTCGVDCQPGYADCDNDPSNGCEVALAQDVMHCGTCSRTCASVPFATATCAMATCGVQCTGTRADCSDAVDDGCETDVSSSVQHCGACGHACEFAGASATCVNGVCSLGACAPGRGDCNHDASDGCEHDVTADNANCGACGHACDAGFVCNAGTCASQCASGQTLCGMACVDRQSSAGNCGSCGHACAMPAHATATCSGGACGFACLPSHGDCNGLAGDGCEADLSVTVANCGSCGTVCAAANASVSCVAARCAQSCNAGFADCNADVRDGCEVDLGATATSCGACGQACVLSHATALCSSGACGIAACVDGFGDCDQSSASGCETDVRTSGQNCGTCGHACGPGTACVAGTCASTCGALTYCPAAATCVDVATDASNCGACAHACPAGQGCAAGTCVIPAPPNDRCTAPIDLALAAGRRVTVTGTTAGAALDLTPSCGSGAAADVFYRFTVTQNEMVYADTFGSGRDTVLYFATGCGTPITGHVTPNDIVCNDDAATIGCTSDGVQSQVVARFAAGTYYLVVASKSGVAGAFNLRVDHLPVGNGDVAVLPPGNNNLDGSIGTSSGYSGTCGGRDSGEDAFWWRSCSSSAAGNYSFNTCDLIRTNFHSVTSLLSAVSAAEDKCSDDSGFFCLIRGSVNGSVGAGAGLRVLLIDGESGTHGNYRITSQRP